MEVDIKGLNKAKLLAELYNKSKPLGLGMFYYDPTPITEDECQKMLDKGQNRFDYLNGRVMKVDLSGDMLDVDLYDRDNGIGAAESIVRQLMIKEGIL